MNNKNKSLSIKKCVWMGGWIGIGSYILYIVLLGLLPKNDFRTAVGKPFYIIVSPIEQIGVELFGQNPVPILLLMAVWWFCLGVILTTAVLAISKIKRKST